MLRQSFAMEYMTYTYLNEIMIINIAQSMKPSLNAVAVPGRVGMEECSLVSF